jgi:hypothetical protein
MNDTTGKDHTLGSTSRPMKLRLGPTLALTASLLAIPGCALDSDEEPTAESDESAYTQGSTLGRKALLAVARSASFDLLTRERADGGIGLSRRAAQAILAHRAGPDGTVGTDDDGVLDTVAALHALPNVGRASIGHIQTFALGSTVARQLPVAAEEAMTLGQLLRYETPQSAEALCGGRGRFGISYDGGDGTIATYSGTWNVSVSLDKNDAVTFTFAEGQGLAMSRAIELLIDTEAVDGQWRGGVVSFDFPRFPGPIQAGAGLEGGRSGGGSARFTTPSPTLRWATHSAKLWIDVVDGQFAFGASIESRGRRGTASFVCRPRQG